MSSNHKFSYRFFPFSPGVKWKMNNHIYISPDVPIISFDYRLKDKNVTVCAYGGFIETFLSLSILEMINHYSNTSNLFWCGYDTYYNLLNLQGIAKPYKGIINKNILKRYPIPLFFDRDDNSYFNCLNNYLRVTAFNFSNSYKDQRPIIEQVVEKGLFKWNNNFIPKLRNLDNCENVLKKYKGLSKFSIDKPFIILVNDSTGYSNHTFKCIDWNYNQVKSFISMFNNIKMQIVILSNKQKYFGHNISTFPFNIELFTYLIKNGNYLISRDIDLLLYALMMSNISLISEETFFAQSIIKNAEFLNKNNDIYMVAGIEPINAWKYIMEKYHDM